MKIKKGVSRIESIRRRDRSACPAIGKSPIQNSFPERKEESVKQLEENIPNEQREVSGRKHCRRCRLQ